ncbi:hypothetical protein ADL12_32380 [Streptomyces regalis]|uniref:Uncharacterized protein n=1 Tax=Streptomyces regalis TaxID=68262 RepID=A0A117MN66_9ACTN|nr:hypothetical protein ADL12_32380 [Streptomyces regalis]
MPASVAPSAGLLASVAAWFWIDLTQAGHVAFLLIAHPPERRPDESPQEIEARMRGLADALTLAAPHKPLPHIGPRLFMHRSADALLSLDDCDYLLRVPIGGEWARFACAGGTVTIAVGLDPLGPGAPLAVVDAYVTERVIEGRLYLGKTRAEHPRSAARPGVIPV